MDRYTERSAAAAGGTGELNALLGKGSEFDGKLAFEGTVRIDGTFTGEITTSDMLIIGESAKVNAEVSCGTIVVHGEVNGNIKASQAVELHKPARVKGDVSTPSLMVERGVVFEGRSKMEDLEDKIVPMRTVSGGEAD
ncbi:MAG: polymer-forming cytoskeletal protein [Chloroflexi bacterium]|nr:polymer-forming cytoskeletal protein [Chloroflexota bacterium]